MQDAATIFSAWIELAHSLPSDAQRGRFYDAICRYAVYGEEPNLTGTTAQIFQLIRERIDLSVKRRIAQRSGAAKRLQNRLQTGLQNESQTELQTKLQCKVYKKSPHKENTPPASPLKEPKDINHKRAPLVSPPSGGMTAPARASKFTKPTVAEVAAYCAERKNNVDPQQFCDFYESKGWIVGKSPMKNWMAAVRTWERGRGNRAEPIQGWKQSQGKDYNGI